MTAMDTETALYHFTDDELVALKMFRRIYPEANYIGRNRLGKLYLFYDEPRYDQYGIFTSWSINRSRRIELPEEIFPGIGLGVAATLDDLFG